MAGADVPAGFLYPQSRKGSRFTVSIDNALCHYRGDQELPSFAERNLSFPDEKKNIRRVRIPMIWGGRTVFFAPPMGYRFEAAPSKEGAPPFYCP